MHPKCKFLGILTFIVPVIIMTYYAVIGGWITKCAVLYLTGQAQAAANDNYFTGMTVERFLEILLDAMSRLFFSLSVSMGVMITYGSYVKPQVNLSKSVNQIEVFDAGVALPEWKDPKPKEKKKAAL